MWFSGKNKSYLFSNQFFLTKNYFHIIQIDVLQEVLAVTQGTNVEVYLDGGIRLGTDVMKALALGARAVFIGRPAWWGLAYKVCRVQSLVLFLFVWTDEQKLPFVDSNLLSPPLLYQLSYPALYCWWSSWLSISLFWECQFRSHVIHTCHLARAKPGNLKLRIPQWGCRFLHFKS